MTRLLEIIFGMGVFVVLLAPLLALFAGVVALLTGIAFIPVFAPLTTALAIGFFFWMAIREAKREAWRKKRDHR